MARNNWSREETVIAFNAYCKIPFKNCVKTNPTVIKYAKIIGRSPSSISMKLGNFGRLDPELKKQGIVGLTHGSKMEKTVWDEFYGDWEKLAFESELLIAQYSNKSIEDTLDISVNDEEIKLGLDKDTIVKQRVNQSFFRSTILSSYNSKCCITGLSIKELLVASHIIPWAKDSENRMNPRNGLCLNSIHDKAFDRGFITITPDYKVLLSPCFEEVKAEKAVIDLFYNYDGTIIQLPDKFLPSKEFLDYHYNKIFIKN